VDHYVMPLTK